MQLIPSHSFIPLIPSHSFIPLIPSHSLIPLIPSHSHPAHPVVFGRLGFVVEGAYDNGFKKEQNVYFRRA
jgi:hypothetical protein